MHLVSLELSGFKSFAKKTELLFGSQVTAIVGPNGSGKSNVAEAFRWVLGEQSLKSLRGKRGEDLIFSGAGAAGRLSRASATVVFDNRDKTLDFDFDEVSITRTVFKDGVNEYRINNSVVRLRDVLELLSGASLGPSGHHIISQGEADRILNSSLRERRDIIEEALGLKSYHWKIEESERKLEKTEENIKQVESLRREIAPHIKFLKKQVEKVEKTDELRRELKSRYLEYFRREENYLEAEKAELSARRSGPEGELSAIVNKLGEVEALLSSPDETTKEKMTALELLERSLRDFKRRHDELARTLGRLEGMIEIRREEAPVASTAGAAVPFAELESFSESVSERVNNLSGTEEASALRSILEIIKHDLTSFLSRFRGENIAPTPNRASIESLISEKEAVAAELEALEAEEVRARAEAAELSRGLEEAKSKLHGAERERYELRAKKTELEASLHDISSRELRLSKEAEDFSRELETAMHLVDTEVGRFRDLAKIETGLDEPRETQENRRREIERLKIRLEDMGGESGDVLMEYKEVTERDEYLGRELLDLEASAASLQTVMADLKERLSVEFKEGIEKINKEFGNYFSLMFGGGTAELAVIASPKRRRSIETDLLEAVTEESGPAEEGIDINVSLPRKKVKGLVMMSGGERALTSIALLFAMSQVNPPPFLILDETDAALDEANSRKYGDMIERLSKESQLILITHNRETMSRAGILYGVTMGADGISKLLSIKFDEAAATWAK